MAKRPLSRRQDLTAARARELLAYDPKKGWLTRRTPWIAGNGCMRAPAGTRVGTIENSRGLLYRSVKVDGVVYREHVVIWLIVRGEYPACGIDHKDGDGSNNKWSNLREATSSQNNQNRKAFKSNTTGYKGVKRAKGGKFGAHIQAHLGTYRTPLAAYRAYCRAAAIIHREFANTTGPRSAPAAGVRL